MDLGPELESAAEGCKGTWYFPWCIYKLDVRVRATLYLRRPVGERECMDGNGVKKELRVGGN